METELKENQVQQVNTKNKSPKENTGGENQVDRMDAQSQLRQLRRLRMQIRICLLIALLLVLILAGVYGASLLQTMEGRFVVSALNRKDSQYQISLSETAGFLNPTTKLTGGALEGMDNITYAWLPEDLDSYDGGHNGENYIAYSFYLRNTGEKTLDYEGRIIIEESTLGVEEAVRIMVIKNGKRSIYAAPQKGTTLPEPNTKTFVSSTLAAVVESEGYQPGQTDRYTVVVWLEGEDPECVDRIKGGKMRIRMDFSVLNDEQTESREDAV